MGVVVHATGLSMLWVGETVGDLDRLTGRGSVVDASFLVVSHLWVSWSRPQEAAFLARVGGVSSLVGVTVQRT